MWRLAISLFLAGAAPAAGQSPPTAVVQPLPGVTADGRYFGHIPYPQMTDVMRVPVVSDDPRAKPCELHRDAVAALYRLLGAARADGVALWPISCFRPVSYQQGIFCGAGLLGPCRDPADRARSVAPGGYSEHATGYALDFGTLAPAGCNDLDPCMSGTPGGLWLRDHARDYGFELSFPPGNKQGVTWEPWHWRWVGVRANEFGAGAARAVFARARALYPASPAVADAKPAPVMLKPVDRNRFTGPRD